MKERERYIKRDGEKQREVGKRVSKRE